MREEEVQSGARIWEIRNRITGGIGLLPQEERKKDRERE